MIKMIIICILVFNAGIFAGLFMREMGEACKDIDRIQAEHFGCDVESGEEYAKREEKEKQEM